MILRELYEGSSVELIGCASYAGSHGFGGHDDAPAAAKAWALTPEKKRHQNLYHS